MEGGKTEGPTTEQTLSCYRLRDHRRINDIARIVGKKRLETTLAQIFFLIEEHEKGISSLLLSDKGSNIFYVRDRIAELSAVRVFRESEVWCFYSYSPNFISMAGVRGDVRIFLGRPGPDAAAMTKK